MNMTSLWSSCCPRHRCPFLLQKASFLKLAQREKAMRGLAKLCIQILHTQSAALISIQVTPLTALKFAELTLKAGIPKGVVNILPGSGKNWGEERVGLRSSSYIDGPSHVGKAVPMTSLCGGGHILGRHRALKGHGIQITPQMLSVVCECLPACMLFNTCVQCL